MSPAIGFSWHDADLIAAIIDGVDEMARQMEQFWGVGRLELLVDDELRLKFRRQFGKFNEAIEAGDVERVRRHGEGMKKAWAALDLAAKAAGGVALDPNVWEIAMPDGRVLAFTRTNAEAAKVIREGRYIEAWTVEEITRVIAQFPLIASAKHHFPGATVKSVKAKRPAFNEATGDDLPF